jgi:hypothetical protein
MGSKEKRSPLKLKSNKRAGLPKVKEGIMDTPLLVAVITPPICLDPDSCACTGMASNSIRNIKNRSLGKRTSFFVEGKQVARQDMSRNRTIELQNWD